MTNPRPLVAAPTAEAIERFSRATTEERFAWWLSMLELVFATTNEEQRAAWRAHREAARGGGSKNAFGGRR